MRTRTSLLASVVLGIVLLALAVMSWSALDSIRQAQRETLNTREAVIAYSGVLSAVAAEAAAEAGYRRAPGPEARVRLEAAIADVDRALEDAYTATDRRDGPTLASLKLLNQRYVDQVRSTLDSPVVGVDDRVAGPALDSIQRLLGAAVSGHRVELAEATRTEIELVTRLRWVLPAAFGLALAIVGWTMRKLIREHRRVGRDAAVATELARTRAELLAEEQRQVLVLGELERSREDFLAMVSHDLVNPITVIDWYADVIAESDEVPAEVRRQATVIRDRARQVQRLVGDLGRGASPSALVDAADVDLSGIVGDAVEAASERAQRATLELTARCSAAPIRGDADRLRQVVDNLLGNAIKFTPAGGAVSVEVRADGVDAVLRVSDTGIGIPADQIDQIFETYYRASTAAKAGIAGTGLGLAITKSIVEGHGGSIRAMPAEPHGTTFEARIPLHRTDRPGAGPGRASGLAPSARA